MGPGLVVGDDSEYLVVEEKNACAVERVDVLPDRFAAHYIQGDPTNHLPLIVYSRKKYI